MRCLSVTKCRRLTQATLNADIQRYQNRFCESSKILINDVLIANLVNHLRHAESNERFTEFSDLAKPVMSLDLDTSELVELLQRSAVEHLTTCRQLLAQDYGSMTTSVTADFEALYAYKCGEYQRCLQLSTYNVRTMIGGSICIFVGLSCAFAFPEFIQLLDNNIASLVGLTLLAGVDRSNYHYRRHLAITQLSLSLYLMTQCQIKLRHSLTSLAQTLDYVEDARRKYRGLHEMLTLDRLLLKLTERKILRYISVDS